jgi:hypothetical protein
MTIAPSTVNAAAADAPEKAARNVRVIYWHMFLRVFNACQNIQVRPSSLFCVRCSQVRLACVLLRYVA